MANPKLLKAPAGRLVAAAREDRDLDSGGEEVFDSEAVPDKKGLLELALRRVAELARGEDPVDVEDDQAHRREPLEKRAQPLSSAKGRLLATRSSSTKSSRSSAIRASGH